MRVSQGVAECFVRRTGRADQQLSLSRRLPTDSCWVPGSQSVWRNIRSHTGFWSDPERLLIYLHSRFSTCLQQRAAELPTSTVGVISLSSSTLTADCRGNVQRRWGKTAGKQTEPEALASAEFEHKHTDTHTACRDSLGAIRFLAILLTLASLMVVNAFSWMLRSALCRL